MNHADDRTRTMFKIRMNPSQPQVRRWDVPTMPQQPAERPIFFVKRQLPETVESILMTPEPWFEQDTGRLEFLNRVKLWRHLSRIRPSTPTTGRPGWRTPRGRDPQAAFTAGRKRLLRSRPAEISETRTPTGKSSTNVIGIR